MKKHAVHKLYEMRLSQATKPFNARGSDVVRCPDCRIDQRYCICDMRPSAVSTAGFLLLYYDDEVLKPSNTGKLIADMFEDTFAFIWKRTEANPEMLKLLADPQWFPIVVFPAEHVDSGRQLHNINEAIPSHKRPLLIMLDGSWREAKKMFRKSPYLDAFPVFSIDPPSISQYQVRKASRDHQLATAEVVSLVLGSMGEVANGELLQTWFQVFGYRYQQGKTRKNRGDSQAEERLATLVNSQS